jgi:hypothetical protein
MVRRKLTIPERWQAVGMHNGGFSHIRVAEHFRVNHSIIVRLTVHVQVDLAKRRRLIFRRERQRPFSTASALHGNLALGGYISTRTVIKRLHHQGMRARRPTVDIMSSPCSIWLVTWSFGVDYSHMETGPLVWWKSFFVTPYRQSCKGLAPTKHFISGQPHFGHNCFWGWGCNCLGLFFLWL